MVSRLFMFIRHIILQTWKDFQMIYKFKSYGKFSITFSHNTDFVCEIQTHITYSLLFSDCAIINVKRKGHACECLNASLYFLVIGEKINIYLVHQLAEDQSFWIDYVLLM